ncbi:MULTISPECIES: hypothetical protein [Burkholderia]|uniref:Uncharacterized protein n=1 Tax=Burkholderia pyrrocinia TaxID=60550 RepID=A0A318INV9_BURPY|nr:MULTISPECIES: hypothetical protein [Burkholderia]PXX35167.1 hypothetical protein NA66_1007179 [Burkholderia pyrrocinia]SFW66299.1 hypothetical protein SAMN03159384_03629 [Burkholderia sp. NFACC33-1]SFY28511.1 hypothetical protein SAMN03159408_03964 [Burkholderia sp. NFPP32]
MDIFTKENLGLLLGLIGAVGAIPVFKGYFVGALTSNSSRKLNKLREERAFFVRLNASPNDVAIYLVKGVLIAMSIIGVSMMFHGMPSPDSATHIALVDTVGGFAVYMIAIWRLGKINRLAKFERTLDALDRQIARLEQKLSANRAPAN